MEGVEHLCSGNLLFKFGGHWYADCAGYCNSDVLITVLLGPLCSAEACSTADQERERIMSSHRAFDAIAAKKKEKEAESEEKKKENLENGKKKEAEWKLKEAQEDAAKAAKAKAEQAQLI